MNEPTAEHTDSAERDESPPLLAGRYRLQEALGEGAMGQVYEAEHVLMKKKVAIKILRPELSEDDEIVARFHREAQAAAALDHPNVCQATDFGQTDDGAFFLVMEYLEGQTLQRTLSTYGRLTKQRALHIATQIAAALEQAHEQGIVHRDLKPENIMLIDRHGDPDTVKIMDFGIARLVATAEGGDADDAATRLTRQGMVYGTPHYMSPEQVAGDEVDTRTDIYALGVVLFEMLTGSPPYDADSIARVMGQHVTEPIPSLSTRCDEERFPTSLQRLLDSLMAKDRTERPATATEVIGIIESIDPDKDVAVDRPNPGDQSTLNIDAVGADGSQRSSGPQKTILTRQRMILAAITFFFVFAAFSIVMAGALYMVFTSSPEHQAQVVEEQRETLLEEERIVSALETAEQGDRSEIDALLEEFDDNAHLHFLALQADLQAGRSVDLIDEAASIFALDDRYAHEASLIDSIIEQFNDRDEHERAAALLIDHMNSTIRSALATQARMGDSTTKQNRAYQFLEAQDQLQHLQDWERITAELRQASGCSSHREKIEALVAIGDERALPTLEAYQANSTRGCGRLGLSDCYGCIRGDLRDAVQALNAGD